MAIDAAVDAGNLLGSVLRSANEQLGATGRRVAKFIDENRQIVLASSAAALGRAHRYLRRHRAAHRSDAGLRQPRRPQERDLEIRFGLDAGRRHASNAGRSWKRPPDTPSTESLQAHAEGLDVLRSDEMPRPDGCGGSRAGWRRTHRRVRDRAVSGSRDLCFDVAGAEWPPQPHDQCDGIHAGRSASRSRQGRRAAHPRLWPSLPGSEGGVRRSQGVGSADRSGYGSG